MKIRLIDFESDELREFERGDWASVKDDVMLRGVREKFVQHEHLHALLLATGDRHLIEHTRNDRYWGDGGDGTGVNKLGQLLMRVRLELAEEAMLLKF